MKYKNTENNILIAFILNISFAIFELIGGLLTNSIAIISDSIHDAGDSLSIGLAFIFEKISKKEPNHTYTFGYARYSIIGSVMTNAILIVGSILIIISAIPRIINPEFVDYDGVIFLAIIGVVVNTIATYVTHGGHSLNQKSINLHMLEDVLGWLVVLIGAVVMHFTDFFIIDPILSIAVAGFILYCAIKNLISATNIFLEKTPKNISIDKVKKQIMKIEEVCDVHHVHIWNIDEENTYATLHVVSNSYTHELKMQIKDLLLKKFNICHTTVEFETSTETCNDIE